MHDRAVIVGSKLDGHVTIAHMFIALTMIRRVLSSLFMVETESVHHFVENTDHPGFVSVIGIVREW